MFFHKSPHKPSEIVKNKHALYTAMLHILYIPLIE